MSAPEPTTWQPINTAPRDGTKIIALYWVLGKQRIDFARFIDRAVSEYGREPVRHRYWSFDHDHAFVMERWKEPTHWAPIPVVDFAEPVTASSSVERAQTDRQPEPEPKPENSPQPETQQ